MPMRHIVNRRSFMLLVPLVRMFTTLQENSGMRSKYSISFEAFQMLPEVLPKLKYARTLATKNKQVRGSCISDRFFIFSSHQFERLLCREKRSTSSNTPILKICTFPTSQCCFLVTKLLQSTACPSLPSSRSLWSQSWTYLRTTVLWLLLVSELMLCNCPANGIFSLVVYFPWIYPISLQSHTINASGG
jgi:hypothetical protein